MEYHTDNLEEKSFELHRSEDKTLFVERLREVITRYKDFFLKCQNEHEIIDVLAGTLGCKSNVQVQGASPDLVCNDIAIEVEFEKEPYEGVCQAVYYKIQGGFSRAALIHVRFFHNENFVRKLKHLIEYLGLREKNISSFIVFIEQGEVLEL
uniref:Uncharacterized protein n=1 Tax=Thermofilum adornatum TaxID=1365176 RepID=A0A7C1GR51_9CREN